MPYFERSGPIARIMTLFGGAPSTKKPPITTLSPVWTKARVLIFVSVGSATVVSAVAMNLMTPTKQTTRNNGKRSSFFIFRRMEIAHFCVGARRCCRPHWYSVNKKTLQAVLTQIRQLTGNAAALPNEETDCHSVSP